MTNRRAENQRRRVHLTLELPWSADKAIQQVRVPGPDYGCSFSTCILLLQLVNCTSRPRVLYTSGLCTANPSLLRSQSVHVCRLSKQVWFSISLALLHALGSDSAGKTIAALPCSVCKACRLAYIIYKPSACISARKMQFRGLL